MSCAEDRGYDRRGSQGLHPPAPLPHRKHGCWFCRWSGGGARSSDPDAFAPTRLGSPTGTAGAHVVPGDGWGQVEVDSAERLPDIVLLPPPRRGEHVASEQT